MSILINKNTRVVTQGITGKTGQFHTRMCRDYANGRNASSPASIRRRQARTSRASRSSPAVRDAKEKTGVNVSVIYVPPPFAAAAIWEAVEADLDLVICITEGIPVPRHDRRARPDAQAEAASRCSSGPNCPGRDHADEIKIGIMPGHIHKKGRIGVVSRSGTLTYEAVGQLMDLDLGQSSCVASAATR
jgi:succinyl-CoA synthetase alpha subunit